MFTQNKFLRKSILDIGVILIQIAVNTMILSLSVYTGIFYT